MMINLGGRFLFVLTFICTFLSGVSYAYEPYTIYATKCEVISPNERKSQARMRASDAAVFKAVSEIDKVFALKKDLSDHDFNVFVYNIVDNKISDLSIKTTKDDVAEICVEVNGYLDVASIDFDNFSIPESVVEEDVFLDKKPFLYFSATEYYNKTKSKAISEKIKQYFSEGQNFSVTQKRYVADYIIYPKVLKAKIDPINSSTNRMHMIISLDFEDQSNKELVKEHRNKFILLKSGDDEQEKAQDLMMKLFESASVSVLSKLETMALKKSKEEPAKNFSDAELITVN